MEKRPVQYLEGPEAKIIVLDYADLVNPNVQQHIFCKFNSIFVILQVDLSTSIEEAFGFNGLGLLTVRGVPELVSLRATILPLVRKCVAAILYSVLRSLA